MSAWQKDSRKRKVIQNNQIKWLLTCYISISSLCFHSQSAVLQGRKVHPQRRLSVSTIKWLNLLKALSSYPFYCCCNHLPRETHKCSACARLRITELFLQIIWAEKSSCPLGSLCWDLLGLTKSCPPLTFLPDLNFPSPDFPLVLSKTGLQFFINYQLSQPEQTWRRLLLLTIALFTRTPGDSILFWTK